jgi:universal stress protein E
MRAAAQRANLYRIEQESSMNAVHRILVAIRDAEKVPRGLLSKVAVIARASGAQIELFHALEDPVPFTSFQSPSTSAMEKIAQSSLRQLQQLRDCAELQGIELHCTASWDYPSHEAIIRQAARIHADLVIAATASHSYYARILLLRNTDWELIRHCPCPVLLIKHSPVRERPAVLVALSSFRAHAKRAHLDTRLLAAGAALVRLLRGELHVFHAIDPRANLLPIALSARVPLTRRHVCTGDAAAALASTARRIDASIVVMGAVPALGWQRLRIGSIVERALDALECDVLIVKPPGFKSTLPPRAPLGAEDADVHRIIYASEDCTPPAGLS